MTDHNETTQDNSEAIDMSKLVDAIDGAEVLFAIARLLEQQHGIDYGYAVQMRRNANAIRDVTDELQPWVVANEDNPALARMWEKPSERDSVMGAGEHRSELAYRLNIPA